MGQSRRARIQHAEKGRWEKLRTQDKAKDRSPYSKKARNFVQAGLRQTIPIGLLPQEKEKIRASRGMQRSLRQDSSNRSLLLSKQGEAGTSNNMKPESSPTADCYRPQARSGKGKTPVEYVREAEPKQTSIDCGAGVDASREGDAAETASGRSLRAGP